MFSILLEKGYLPGNRPELSKWYYLNHEWYRCHVVAIFVMLDRLIFWRSLSATGKEPFSNCIQCCYYICQESLFRLSIALQQLVTTLFLHQVLWFVVWQVNVTIIYTNIKLYSLLVNVFVMSVCVFLWYILYGWCLYLCHHFFVPLFPWLLLQHPIVPLVPVLVIFSTFHHPAFLPLAEFPGAFFASILWLGQDWSCSCDPTLATGRRARRPVRPVTHLTVCPWWV